MKIELVFESLKQKQQMHNTTDVAWLADFLKEKVALVLKPTDLETSKSE